MVDAEHVLGIIMDGIGASMANDSLCGDCVEVCSHFLRTNFIKIIFIFEEN